MNTRVAKIIVAASIIAVTVSSIIALIAIIITAIRSFQACKIELL